MSNQKETLALIPARSGSKSIPKKNSIDLGGHPLLAYSIAAAKLSSYINRIIITTDSQEFADIAKAYGAEVPFLRPAEYAQDTSQDIEFVQHALDWLKENEKYTPDFIVHLRPTTPLRDSVIIDKAIEEIIADTKATALRSAHESEYTAYKLFRKKGEYINFFGKEDFKENEEYYNKARQILPKTYNCNGYVDVLRPETLEKTGMLHGLNIRAFITDRIADIDRLEDIAFAEQLLTKKEFQKIIDFLHTQKNKPYG